MTIISGFGGTCTKTDENGIAGFETLPDTEYKLNATSNDVTWTSDVLTAPAVEYYDFN